MSSVKQAIKHIQDILKHTGFVTGLSGKTRKKEKESLPATPPGPKNPLGLFVVHYDENSLRYFHGTNKNHLLYTKMRNLSHGCVRNDNDNIQKMKEFIIKRVIKSEDLSGWMDSKRSMTFEFADIDRFPVRIIYKTFMVNKDESGPYIELYQDIYNYKKFPEYRYKMERRRFNYFDIGRKISSPNIKRT